MTTFDSGQPTFGLRKSLVAVNNLDGTFGTAVTVPSVKIMDVNYRTVSAKLEGDDTITATAAVAVEAECTVQFGGITLDVYNVITGLSVSSSGAGSTLRKAIKFDNVNFPYFAIIGQAYAAQGGGDTHIFVPKIKCMDGFDLKMEYGQFIIPSLKCSAVLDPNYSAIFSVIEHATIATLVLPPTWP